MHGGAGENPTYAHQCSLENITAPPEPDSHAALSADTSSMSMIRQIIAIQSSPQALIKLYWRFLDFIQIMSLS